MRGLIIGAVLKFSPYLSKHLHGVRGFLAFAEYSLQVGGAIWLIEGIEKGLKPQPPIDEYPQLVSS